MGRIRKDGGWDRRYKKRYEADDDDIDDDDEYEYRKKSSRKKEKKSDGCLWSIITAPFRLIAWLFRQLM